MTRETISFTNKTDSIHDVLAAHINTLQNYLAKLWNTFAFVGATELTISSGIVTATGNYHTIDTEGNSEEDDLESILLGTNIEEASILIFRPISYARTVIVRHNVGNLYCVGREDYVLDNNEDFCLAIYDSGMSKWIVMFSGAGISDGGWYPIANSWAYASPTTINVPAGATYRNNVGDKIRFKQGGEYKYFYVTGVTSALLTVTGGNVYSVANAPITDIYYSRDISPVGFPGYHSWTPAFIGFSADPTSVVSRFWIIGNLLYFSIYMGVNGISSATQFTISVPVPSNGISGGACTFAVDNGSLLTGAARWAISSGGDTTIDIYSNMASAGWTASGGKRAALTGFYQI
jgi:hypothetical protein